MQPPLTTSRLLITDLTPHDGDFISALVNSEGWLKFIGNRNVHTPEDATAYIQKIKANPSVVYHVVRLKEDNTSIGIITVIKRDYLDHHDIGFAFLPEFAGKGYAYEAANAVMETILTDTAHTHILATTVPTNTNSIKLLTKLGLQFDREIEVENEKLHVYAASTDKLHARSNTFT